MLIPRIFLNKIIDKSSKIQRINPILNHEHSRGPKVFNNQISQHLFTNNSAFTFSKQKIIEDLQKFNQQLELKESSAQENTQPKGNEFLERQQKIVKDFLELTEESFSEHLQTQLKEKYHVDAEMLLMIISTLQDPKIIKQNLIKLYPFVGILQKSELYLMFELILAHRPQTIPSFSTVIPRPLDSIESILLLLSEIYPKEQKIVEWLKEIPLYKGNSVVMVAAGLFAIYERMQQHVKFKNQRLIQRCIDRIIHLAVDQDEQTQISIAILALESPQTCYFAQKLLIAVQNIDYSQIDALKLQIFFIHLQKHISLAYSQARNQVKNKTKYKILEQTEEGQVTQKEEEEYNLAEGQQLEYSKLSQIQKFKFLNNISKKILIKIMDLNWKEVMKLNLLLDYWKLLQTFAHTYPWNSFQLKIVNFTAQKQIILKISNLEIDQILTILEVMEKLKINKSQLLMKCLALLSERLDNFEAHHLIRLARVCVTFVRQCEDFLISVRKEIEGRKFIFSQKEIQQLNQIFKRVLVLFPRPLIR